jgi:acetoin:2,6-dichlorophenolindophenol oxidoreductase subunit beta
MSAFRQSVNHAMRWLAEDQRTVFVGQSVRYDGAAIYHSVEGVPMEKRIEMPVIEDFQLGYCIGLSLTGKLPICIFPRMDFMLLCMNQLVNHLDKLPMFGWKPKLIIRTRVGQKKPLDAGPQHTQNHTKAFQMMLKNMSIIEVTTPQEVDRAYGFAYGSQASTLIVENPVG